MQFEGRTGDARPKCYGEILYDAESQRYRIRVDDAANPGFWLVMWLPQSLMNTAVQEPGTTLRVCHNPHPNPNNLNVDLKE